MTGIKPIGDRIVLRRQKEDTMSDGGIVIPDSASEKPAIGEVIAVGPGNFNKSGIREKLMVSIGDVVTFGKMAAAEINVDGEELWVVHETDVVAIIR